MIDLIEEHREEIHVLCREFGITRLELFGSAATGAFDPERSDVDFIVDFGPWLTRHFDFQERLADVLGRPVDLVMASALRNPRFIEPINESRQLLYAA